LSKSCEKYASSDDFFSYVCILYFLYFYISQPESSVMRIWIWGKIRARRVIGKIEKVRMYGLWRQYNKVSISFLFSLLCVLLLLFFPKECIYLLLLARSSSSSSSSLSSSFLQGRMPGFEGDYK